MVLGHSLTLALVGIIRQHRQRRDRASVVGGHVGLDGRAFTYAVVPLILVGLTLVASYVPARRASLIDPLLALRDE
jgi:ABC-type lipoprotein release transport system permease subunit